MKKTLLASLILATSATLAALPLTAAQAAEVPAGVKLAKVQELVRGNGAEPASLDPQKIEGSPGSRIAKDLFEGLVSQDANGNIIPAVAESWEASPDNKVFTFKLRKDARWSNGEPVTAHDFVYGFQRAVDPKLASPYAWYMQIPGIVNADAIIDGKQAPDALGVAALDNHTFQVTLNKPIPFFVKLLAHQTTFPAPRKTIEKYGETWTKPGHMVSNGAYTLKSWVVNERIVLERNTQYWNNAKTVLDKVSYLPIESENSELSRYRAGEVEMTNGSTPIPLEHFKKLQKEIPDEIRVSPQIGTYYYEFNNRRAPFSDARVRKALSYTINREAIANFVVGQGEKPTYSFTPDNVNSFVKPDLNWENLSYDQRVDAARKLLSEAGYDKSNPLEVTMLYNTSDAHKKVAIAIAQMWKKALGVKVTLENQEWKTFLDTRREGRFDVSRAGWIGDYNEASTMLSLLMTENGNNYARWSNTEYDNLLNKAMTVADESQRAELYQLAEQLIAEEMPVAPVYQYVTGRLVKSYVGGYPMNNPEDNVLAKDLYIMAH